MEEEGEVGGSRAEGLSAIGDRGQAAISLMSDVDGTGSCFLLDSILSTLLKKRSSDVWVVALFFLVIDEMVALDCILNGCCIVRVPFYVWVGPVPQKLTAPPQIKKIPLPFPSS